MPDDHQPGDLTTEQAVAALERFVVDNDELLELEAQVGRFNIFDALGIVRAEIRHSAYLRWLLDPNESHGLGPMFLRPVLMDILRSTDPVKRPPSLSPVHLDGVELRGVSVSTEDERVDVLISCEDPPFVVAIENKIDSGEHSDQLARYLDVVGRKFPGRDALFVYLTREGDEPSHEGWTSYSYRSLHDALARVVRTHEGAIGDDVRVFLDHYIALLRSRFMDDKKIDELVEMIYRQHRQAIDLIAERKSDPRKRLIIAFAERLRESKYPWEVYVSGYGCQFAPAHWLDLMPAKALHVSLDARAMLFAQAWAGPKLLEVVWKVPPSTDFNERMDFVDAIVERGEEVGLKVTGTPTEQWTRVCRVNVHREKEELVDNEKALEAIGKVMPKLEALGERVLPFLREHFSKD